MRLISDLSSDVMCSSLLSSPFPDSHGAVLCPVMLVTGGSNAYISQSTLKVCEACAIWKALLSQTGFSEGFAEALTCWWGAVWTDWPWRGELRSAGLASHCPNELCSGPRVLLGQQEQRGPMAPPSCSTFCDKSTVALHFLTILPGLWPQKEEQLIESKAAFVS